MPHDILAIGNAIVDVIATATPEFLAGRSIPKGSMQLIDAATAEALYAAMGPGREISGGSAANTVAGMAALGCKPAFVGRVADDQLGAVFTHDIRAAGVSYTTPPLAGGNPTGRCLILVTDDGDRTMNTYLGACQELSEADLDAAMVADAAILYLEGYLWDPAAPRAAMKKAIEIMRAQGGKVAFTLSDVFCVEGHRADFQALLANHVDIMFGNEHEVCALYQTESLDGAMHELAKHAGIAVVTRSAAGALVLANGERIEVPGEAVARVVDTTGAGDMFAGGFLAGLAQGRGLADCARIGNIAAAEVISHYGARAEVDLRALVKAKLG
ncbi:carbohydrate kinase [alpha proteobacterium AAP81b]|nr:carbohydrate kinase [alpha proteobacterium AAP81b]